MTTESIYVGDTARTCWNSIPYFRKYWQIKPERVIKRLLFFVYVIYLFVIIMGNKVIREYWKIRCDWKVFIKIYVFYCTCHVVLKIYTFFIKVYFRILYFTVCYFWRNLFENPKRNCIYMEIILSANFLNITVRWVSSRFCSLFSNRDCPNDLIFQRCYSVSSTKLLQCIVLFFRPENVGNSVRPNFRNYSSEASLKQHRCENLKYCVTKMF